MTARNKKVGLRPKAVLYSNSDGTASGRFPDGTFDFVATGDREKGIVIVERYDSMVGGEPTAILTFQVVNAENPMLIPAVENPTWKLQRVKMDNAHYALVRIVTADDLLVAGDPFQL